MKKNGEWDYFEIPEIIDDETMEILIDGSLNISTSLKDKKNVLIFGGDIIGNVEINGKTKNAVVVFRHGMFLVQHINTALFMPLIDVSEDHEIIGNTHDDSKLLED